VTCSTSNIGIVARPEKASMFFAIASRGGTSKPSPNDQKLFIFEFASEAIVSSARLGRSVAMF
jgi:hypothetical protein